MVFDLGEADQDEHKPKDSHQHGEGDAQELLAGSQTLKQKREVGFGEVEDAEPNRSLG